ncbi:hypothetical protein RJ640_001738 [Escallonia rubra]|uniref:Uncharacterized protein n=1 Tax=Escallonia rubra TaxID=112253 RepID=A0AA88UQA2_9ASTE|nr:hypothetical protein RJ640_001738 [Escallonia rubra]
MDLSLYRAAMEGKVDIILQDRTKLAVLHIAAMFGNTECANEVLRYSPSLSCRVNIQGDTPLHIAARKGCSDIVQALVKYTTRLDKKRVGARKEMPRMLNKESDTPLHEAVRNCHFDVVKLLVEEDPEFLCPANNAEETPLYLASEKGYDELVSLILETCTAPAYSGSMASLLRWKPSLVKETDLHGWTPLHFAARIGYASIVSQLLEADKSLGYIADNDDKNTALHIAAGHGHIDVMREFFEHCPDCCEMVNARGRNFLHNAVEHEQKKAVTYILEQCAIAISLTNQKDIDGNTPLHLLVTSDCNAQGLIWHSGADRNAFNKENLTPMDMDLSLYRAVMEGKVGIILQDRRKLEHQLTPNKNTVLHIAAMFGNRECANEVLRYSPSLSCRVNIQGDTALHISSPNGCSGIVEALVKCTRLDKERVGAGKEMLRMLNKENDTALHEAVRNYHVVLVKLLVKEDPDFLCRVNNAEETPLYLASEKGYDDFVSLILETCTEPAYSGSMASLLGWKPSLVKETDLHGWTPLHFAARIGYASIVSQLLEVDKSLGYIADNDDKNTALHIAAGRGHIDVMREFFEHCPDCCEMVNARGRNFLHIAVEHERRKAITYILEKCAIVISLINQKDIDWNTPLHLLATSERPALGLISHSGAHTNAFNKDNLTPVDNDTPQHEAVRNCRVNVVKILAQEDPDFSCPANYAEETPLYMASEKGYDECRSS